MSVKENNVPLKPVPPPLDGYLALFGFRTQTVTASKTLTVADSGTIFFVASGTVTFTIPAPVDGLFFGFFNRSATAMTISAGSGAQTIIGLNDATNDSVAFSTGGQIIGAACIFVSDGSFWHFIGTDAIAATLA